MCKGRREKGKIHVLGHGYLLTPGWVITLAWLPLVLTAVMQVNVEML